ncbi:unnamed protein product [Polarella glacialis]|uniref:Amino acid transporter transmembrane domain-containing protein n=1 Tax=Polarella glacialis TaxID=89957 RepID=A0A813FB06_POLGL|nr:unnamed protein product [Polarella glacialis]
MQLCFRTARVPGQGQSSMYGNGSCVGYMVFIGDFIPAIIKLLDPSLTQEWIRPVCIISAATMMVPLVLPRDISALRHVSPVSIMALIYMTLVIACKCPGNYHENVGTPAAGHLEVAKPTIHFFEAFSLCVFAFNCHLNVVPVAAQLIQPSTARIIKVSARVNILQLSFYCLIGITGYISFIGKTYSDILKNYSDTDGFVAFGRVMLTFTMMVAIPLNLNPTVKSALQIRDYLYPQEQLLETAPDATGEQRPRSESQRIVLTMICLYCQAVVAVLVPNVGTILSLLGATVATAMMLVIPAYCMGVVQPPTWRRRAQQAVLYIFALVSVTAVPITILELVGVVQSPPNSS